MKKIKEIKFLYEVMITFNKGMQLFELTYLISKTFIHYFLFNFLNSLFFSYRSFFCLIFKSKVIIEIMTTPSSYSNELLFSKSLPNNLAQQNDKVILTSKYPVTDNNFNISVNPNVFINQIPIKATNITNCQTKKNANNSQNSLNNQATKKKRVFFTEDEDEKLKNLVKTYGTRKWSLISSLMDGRSSRQCRDRYFNYLVPGYFKGEWSNEEDDLLTNLYSQYGSKWSLLKKYFPGRTPNSLKNRWNYFLCKKYVNDEETQDSINIQVAQNEYNQVYYGEDYLNTVDFFATNDEFQLLTQNPDISYNFMVEQI